jgi:hypothetical protein
MESKRKSRRPHVLGLALCGWLGAAALPGHAGPPLRLAAGTLDTDRTEQQDAFRALRSANQPAPQQRPTGRGTAPWLVQFEGPLQADWKRAIKQSGARIAGYVPDHALLVEATPKSLRAILAHPHVIWAGEYRPTYKRAREVRNWMARNEQAVRECEVVLFRPEDVTAVAQAITRQPGATILLATNLTDRGLIRLRATSPVVETISQWSEVEWIGSYVPPAFLNSVAVQTNFMNVVPVWTTEGLTGSGQVIAVCDTGLDTGETNTLHPDFTGRVAWTQNVGRPDRWDDPEGHGTHVAGSILGSGAASTGLYRGVAYEARLIMQSALGPYGGVNVPPDLNDLFRAAFTNGARIHSNSWGAHEEESYTLECRNLDLFVWEHPSMLILFAAGNEGVDVNEDGVVDLDGIGSPAAAKNCLTVGAAESLRSTNITYGARHPYDYPAEPIFSDLIAGPGSAPQGMAAFSSRGPCDDGRIKPDLVAPGTYIISARSTRNPDTVDKPLGNTNYMFASGTSMATPPDCRRGQPGAPVDQHPLWYRGTQRGPAQSFAGVRFAEYGAGAIWHRSHPGDPRRASQRSPRLGPRGPRPILASANWWLPAPLRRVQPGDRGDQSVYSIVGRGDHQSVHPDHGLLGLRGHAGIRHPIGERPRPVGALPLRNHLLSE